MHITDIVSSLTVVAKKRTKVFSAGDTLCEKSTSNLLRTSNGD